MKKIKKIIFYVSIFLLSMSYAQSQERYYYAFEEKISLNEVKNKVVIGFDKKYLSDIQENLQRNAKIQRMESQNNNSSYILTIENSDIRTLKENLSKYIGIKSINPLYTTIDGLDMSVIDEIVVQFKGVHDKLHS